MFNFTKKDVGATALLGILLLLFYVGMTLAARKFSPVDDELANIPSGLNFLKTGRYTDPTHPPLIRYLFSIPLFVENADPLPDEPTGIFDWHEYGKAFLFKNKVSWQQLLTNVRQVNILLCVVFLLFLFFWTKKIWGRTAGFSALIFMIFEPTFVGHGQLATLDAAFSLVILGSVFSWWIYFKNPSWRNFWWLNLAMGIAFLTKFTSISLIFSMIICFFIFRKKGDFQFKRFWLSPFIWFLMIWAAYLFQIKSPAEDLQIGRMVTDVKVESGLDDLAAQLHLTKSTMMAIKIPAYDFWKGFGMQTFHAMFQDKWHLKEGFQFLNGEYNRRGWRTYFAWTFLLKSTLVSIAFLLIFVFLGAKKWIFERKSPDFLTTILTITPVLLFILCSLGTINIGHRYLMPIYPFLAMGVGFLTTFSQKWVKNGVFLLLFAHILSSCVVWPHHISYFNEFSRSKFHLADSNIDWGQDLLFLQKDLEKAQKTSDFVCGEVFSLAKPADLGMMLPIPGNSLADLHAGLNTIYVSVNVFLNKNEVHPDGKFPFLNDLKPARMVGTSILVFEIRR
jgi:hypothetical protein